MRALDVSVEQVKWLYDDDDEPSHEALGIFSIANTSPLRYVCTRMVHKAYNSEFQVCFILKIACLCLVECRVGPVVNINHPSPLTSLSSVG